jgi:signal transduction histidine kinase
MDAIEAEATLPGQVRVVARNRHGKPRRDVGLGDVLAGLVLAAGAVHGHLWPGGDMVGHASALALIFTLAMVLSVVWARRFPIAMAGVFAGASVAGWAFTGVDGRCGATLPAAFWIACVIGLRVRDRRAALGVALVIVGICAMGRVDANMDFSSAFAMMAPITIGFWFGGRTIRQRADAIRRVSEQNAQIAATRERTAQLAVQTDRGKIADGLDDLLHQRLSDIAAQASAGRGHADDVETAQQAFACIAHDGRDTLARMREVVGSLRSDIPLQPQPDLSRLADLVAGAKGRLEIEGQPRPLPSGVELSGYRIVEQLVRSVSSPDVLIRFAPDELELRVTATAPAPIQTAEPVVRVAAERAALHGGSLIATQFADQWQWVARLPLSAGLL